MLVIAESNPNIALKKTVYQISTYGNDEASFAVDGNYNQKKFSHTNDGENTDHDQWWIVDLEKEYSISEIYVTGRENQGVCLYYFACRVIVWKNISQY